MQQARIIFSKVHGTKETQSKIEIINDHQWDRMVVCLLTAQWWSESKPHIC